MNTIARYGAALALIGAVGAGAGLTYQSFQSHSSAAVAPAEMTKADAVRLAKQATFGPNTTVVNRIMELGAAGWIDEQLSLSDSTYADMTQGKYAQPDCDGAADAWLCIQTYFRAPPVAMRFYSNALSKPDQLRQRVAFALSQMIVTSGLKVESTAGVAAFQQIMLDNAFGDYETILREVTLSPAMGDYLDMASSIKGAPNQNYARELMQIFSIYPSQLNFDGTLKVNDQGQTTPTYTEADVDNVARALTGWTYARYGSGVWHERKRNYAAPMVQYPASYNGQYFDDGAKTFLGKTVPEGATPEANLNAVIKAVFDHPNVAPYVSRQLIQHLVTANPDPAYVARVAAVFERNGQGKRGDLGAVVKAILLDPEARGDSKSDLAYGKVKEPVLHVTSFLRLMNATSDGYFAFAKGQDLNQRVFEAPSVFNFYPWDFPLAQSGGLVSPASKLMGGALDYERHNFVFNYTLLDDILGTARDYKPNPALGSRTGTKVDWRMWEAMNIDQQIAHMDLMLLNNTMSQSQKAALRTAMEAVGGDDRAAVARRRAQTGLYIVLTSPQFQVDR